MEAGQERPGPGPTEGETPLDELFDHVFIEGLVSRLRRDFRSAQEDAPDAVQIGFEKLVAKRLRNEEVSNPRGYVTAVAVNKMRLLVSRRVRRHLSLEQMEEDGETVRVEPDWFWSPEEHVLVDAVYADLKKHVEAWETDNVRVVTLLYLEAAYRGEPLSSGEVAEAASAILAVDVDPDFVRTWKHRGMGRLKQYLLSRESHDKKG